MDARRKMEGLYKMRLDKSQNERAQLELQLSIIQCYAQVGTTPTDENAAVLTDNIGPLLTQLGAIIAQIQHLMSASPHTSSKGVLSSSDLAECESLSKLELERISLAASTNVSLQTLEDVLRPFKVTYGANVSAVHSVTSDRVLLTRILSAIKSVFPTPGLAVIERNDKTATLTFKLRDSADHNGLAYLFEQVDLIMTGAPFSIPKGSLNVTMLFVAKCLTQCLEGDVKLADNEILVTIPCGMTQSPLQPPPPSPPVSIDPVVPLPIEKRSFTDSPQVIPKPSPPVLPEPNLILDAANRTPPVLETIPTLTPPASSSTPKLDPLQGRNLNILLAEDNQVLRDIFKRYWEKRGHNVFIATNGQEAVNQFKEHTFAIVFSDIEFPIKDGLAVTREIREYEREKQRKPTPIIGLSGNERKHYAEKALESGMNEFTSKGTNFPMHKIYELVVKYCATD